MKTEDFSSPCWKRLTKLLQDRLDELRELNDSQSFDPIKTAAIRGSIAEVKKILALADSASASLSVVPGAAGDDDSEGYAPEI